MIRICELGPRDGIQVFRRFIPTDLKIEFINALSESGLKEIHVTYFAHPKVIPQVKDADEVAKNIRRVNGVTYIGFIPNEVGFRRAIYAKMDRISFFISVEESLNYLFFRKTSALLLEDFIAITREAKGEGLEVEAFIVRAFERENWNTACSIAEKFLKSGVDILYFSNFGEPVDMEYAKQIFKDIKSINAEIGLHFYLSSEEMERVIKAAMDCGIKRFATSICSLGLRSINGRLVSLPSTELVAKLGGLKNLNLKKPKEIAFKIISMVEKVGRL